MAPLPGSRICSNSCFKQLQMPRRLTAFTRSNSSTLASAISETGLQDQRRSKVLSLRESS